MNTVAGSNPWSSEEVDRFFSLSLDLLCIAGFDGYFKRVNASWERTLGWTAGELTSQPYMEFIHPDDRNITAEQSSNLSDGLTTLTFVNRYRTKDGGYRYLEWNALPITDRQLIYAVARDITEQRASEQRVKEAKEEAIRANQAKSEFLSRMSHDLRTPLNAILGFAQLLGADPLDAGQRDSVKQIMAGGRHLLELINEVLDLARIESGRLALSPEPVAMSDVLQAAVDFVRPIASQRRVHVDVDAAHSELHVVADRQRLNQILHNLLSNAIKYNQVGGTVTLAVTRHGVQRLRIEVRDTGPGIRPELLERLFQPFDRLGAEQTTTDGTGLGLVIARGLADAMSGSIGVTSEVDRGSTFWVELPAATPIMVGSVMRDRTAIDQGAGATRGLVLYIEDNASNRLLMTRVLARRPGVRLRTAGTGALGLEMVRAERPDLILLDLHLPDVSGEDVLRQLWAEPTTRDIPVSVLSADATPGQNHRMMRAGARAYLTKPIDVDRVLQLVDETLADAERTPLPTS